MAENGSLIVDGVWRKSSYSGGSAANCVEVGSARGVVLVRDSKSSETLTLNFDRTAWSKFLARL